MVDDETRTIHTVTVTLRTTNAELASALARDAFEFAKGASGPEVDWGVDTDHYQESRLLPMRLHDSDIEAIAQRVRGETEPVS